MPEESAKSLCFECKRPLVEIDNRGQRLHGCMTCNIWWSLTGGAAVKLAVEDLAAPPVPLGEASSSSSCFMVAQQKKSGRPYGKPRRLTTPGP